LVSFGFIRSLTERIASNFAVTVDLYSMLFSYLKFMNYYISLVFISYLLRTCSIRTTNTQSVFISLTFKNKHDFVPVYHGNFVEFILAK